VRPATTIAVITAPSSRTERPQLHGCNERQDQSDQSRNETDDPECVCTGRLHVHEQLAAAELRPSEREPGERRGELADRDHDLLSPVPATEDMPSDSREQRGRGGPP
jgi:hypothetical protein